jgi:hypothetical protein
VLDENILPSQRLILQNWRISVRQIGYDIGRKGAADEEIMSLLLRLRQATFCTLDADFYRRTWRHNGYCLVYLSVERNRVAKYVRQLLRHENFKSRSSRMGKVIAVSPSTIRFWQQRADTEIKLTFMARR